MIAPKEKASNLIDEFIQLSVVNEDDIQWYHPKPYTLAKQCAIKCCKEVLGYMGADRGYEFWTNVLYELEHYGE